MYDLNNLNNLLLRQLSYNLQVFFLVRWSGQIDRMFWKYLYRLFTQDYVSAVFETQWQNDNRLVSVDLLCNRTNIDRNDWKILKKFNADSEMRSGGSFWHLSMSGIVIVH
jgi:hypothetical protein